MSLEENLDTLSREELISYIKNKLKKKKYGLVWEEKPEDIIVKYKNKYPILKRVDTKSIKNDNGPTNILIEGDNYHALQILSYTHKDKVDVIYIDPPYNTGNKDFIYNDNFVGKDDEYRHSEWLSFMKKRLELSKKLLSDDGIIFISIDDNEQAQLKLLCDSVFGSSLYVGTLIWQRAKGGGNAKKVVRGHEYILCYSKSENLTLTQKGDKSDEHFRKWKKGDQKDKYIVKNKKLYFINDDVIRRVFGKYEKGVERRCEYENILKFKGQKTKDEVDEKIKKGEYVLKKVNGGLHYVCRLDEVEGMRQVMYTILQGFLSEVGKNDLSSLGMGDLFDYPKPINLIKTLIDTILNKNAVVLDFFAGSGTTGQAVLELNKEDGGNRQFILVTNNGDKNGDHKIAEEVTYERLKRVIHTYGGSYGNLEYMKIDFIDKVDHTDSMKLRMTNHCSDILCLKEGVFQLEQNVKNAYSIYSGYINDVKHSTAIYYAVRDDYFEKMKKEVEKIKGTVSTYVFSLSNIAEIINNFEGLKKNINLEQIPKKILNIYDEINRNTLNKI